MKQVIQFYGTKLVMRPLLSTAKIDRAQQLVNSALAGEVKFAWQRIKPTRKRHYDKSVINNILRGRDRRDLVGKDYDDVAKHRRAENWNRRNVYDVFPTDSLIKEWKGNLERIKRAIETLKTAHIITYGYIDGSGRMEIHDSTHEKVSRIHDQCGTNIRVCLRGKTPENELVARRKGKLHSISAETHAADVKLRKIKDEIKGVKDEINIRAWSSDMDMTPRPKSNPHLVYYLPLVPDTGRPKFPPVSHEFVIDKHLVDYDMGNNINYTPHIKFPFVTNEEFNSKVAVSNTRISGETDIQIFKRRRIKRLYLVFMFNIFKMQLGIREHPKSGIKCRSIEGIFINI